MRRRVVIVSIMLIVLLLIGPVIVRQFTSTDHRSLEGVGLSTLEFEEVQFRNVE